MLNSGNSISRWKIYTYGLGEFGFNFFLVFLSYHLMYFLTNVLFFPTRTAAIIYAAVQWLEKLSLLASGYIIDRAHFRNGKYCPWLMIGSIVCMVGMILTFTRLPLSIDIYAVVFPLFYLMAYWGYNFMWVGYRSIMGCIARHPEDTVSLTTAASQMGTVSMLIFSAVGSMILYGFSEISTGYTVSAILYGGLMVLSMVVVYWISRPYDNGSTVIRSHRKAEESVSARIASLCKLLQGPLLPFFLAFVFRTSIQMLSPALMCWRVQTVCNAILSPTQWRKWWDCFLFRQSLPNSVRKEPLSSHL